MPEDFASIETLERELVRADTRHDAVRLGELLADDFMETGKSGRVFDKTTVIDMLLSRPAQSIELLDLHCERLDGDVVLARFDTRADGATTRRCSIWTRRDGRWRLRYHQGTLVSE